MRGEKPPRADSSAAIISQVAARPRVARRVPGMLLTVLGLLAVTGPFASDVYLPAMPEMADQYHTDAVWIQATISTFILGMAGGQLSLGPLSDALGRRRLLIAGTAVCVVATALVATAPTVELLLTWRVIQGIGAAAGVVIGRAIVTDLTDDDGAGRAFSILGLIGGIGPIIGPPLGALILVWSGWPAIFWSLAALSTATLFAVIFLVPETLPKHRRLRGGLSSLVASLHTLRRTPAYVSSVLMMCFGAGALFAYIAASPFLVQSILGFDPLTYTLVFAVNGIGLVIAGAVSARIVGRFASPVTLCRIGLALVGAGGAVMVVASTTGAFTPPLVLPALFLIPTGMGLIYGPGTALVVAGVRTIAGTALAILGCGQFVLAGITAPLSGVAGETESLPVSLVILTCGALAIACLTWFMREQRRHPHSTPLPAREDVGESPGV